MFMESVDAAITHLALDPFESLSFHEAGVLELGGRTWSRDDLAQTLDLDTSETALLAGPDWGQCETCSDPGPDDDPFPPPTRSPSRTCDRHGIQLS
jgi:hypothetical protein